MCRPGTGRAVEHVMSGHISALHIWASLVPTLGFTTFLFAHSWVAGARPLDRKFSCTIESRLLIENLTPPCTSPAQLTQAGSVLLTTSLQIASTYLLYLVETTPSQPNTKNGRDCAPYHPGTVVSLPSPRSLMAHPALLNA
ncbi:hypothetical protein N657DRAFT_206225 [Parathielavia appendiculata]|uniref:Uncharacterized protein n=1 Tax=Parathielavia appendiculata TaxID=2587402 RepID=A0AAN6U6K1_9PEZI|nr:hypothetical protein N657DRAFT_206225 [Parathielavia appendiculata]